MHPGRARGPTLSEKIHNHLPARPRAKRTGEIEASATRSPRAAAEGAAPLPAAGETPRRCHQRSPSGQRRLSPDPWTAERHDLAEQAGEGTTWAEQAGEAMGPKLSRRGTGILAEEAGEALGPG